MHARLAPQFPVMANYGQCKASLRNGQRCRVAIETEGSEFCPHHTRLAGEHGSDAVMNGSVAKQRSLRVVENETKPTNVATVTPTTPIDPANVRPMLQRQGGRLRVVGLGVDGVS